MNILNLIGEITVSAGLQTAIKVARIVFTSLMILLSIVLIVSVLLQPSGQEGLGAISGGSDTFFSKNKGRTREGMLKRLTIICSISIAVIAILFFITIPFYNPVA